MKHVAFPARVFAIAFALLFGLFASAAHANDYDFPELPEPYNNLAALYAAQSKFDQARAALEQALRLNPNYATAHENLGDVYARLAAQEYVRAQQFASTNASVGPKLSLIRQIFTPKAEAEAAALPPAPPEARKPVGRVSK